MDQGRGIFTISPGDPDTQWEMVTVTVSMSPTTTEKDKKFNL